MAKKNKETRKKEEAKSRANHPTARSEVEIEQAWAKALTDEAVLANLYRFVTEPTGWKKTQKQTLLEEVVIRFDKLEQFKNAVRQDIKQFRQDLTTSTNAEIAGLHCAQSIERGVDKFYPFTPDLQQPPEFESAQ